MEQDWGTWPNLRKLVQGGVATTLRLRLTLKRTELGLRRDQVTRSATWRAVWDGYWVGDFVSRLGAYIYIPSLETVLTIVK